MLLRLRATVRIRVRARVRVRVRVGEVVVRVRGDEMRRGRKGESHGSSEIGGGREETGSDGDLPSS